MPLPRMSFFNLTTLALAAASLWYIANHHLSRSDTFHTKVHEQQPLIQSQSAQSNSPFALTDILETDLSAIIDSSDTTNTSLSDVDAESVDCGLLCKQTIEALKLPYQIADHEYEKLRAQASLLASYLQKNSAQIDEFIEIALQADGNKRKTIIAVFNFLSESDRLMLGQALIQSNSEHQRLDGIQVLASTESMSQRWVNDFSELLITEQHEYVRQSAVQALSRSERFKGDATVLAMLSQVMQVESDASVRGAALLASARLTHDPQSLLYDSFNAIRSEQSEYQQYGVRAMEELFNRHTRNGGELSEYDRNQLEQLVVDLMEPEFNNIPASVRRDIENLFERFH